MLSYRGLSAWKMSRRLTSSEVKDFKCSNTASINVKTSRFISARNFLSQPYNLSFESTENKQTNQYMKKETYKLSYKVNLTRFLYGKVENFFQQATTLPCTFKFLVIKPRCCFILKEKTGGNRDV